MTQEDVNNFVDKMFNSSNCTDLTVGAAIRISLGVDSDELSDDDMNNAKQIIADILGNGLKASDVPCVNSPYNGDSMVHAEIESESLDLIKAYYLACKSQGSPSLNNTDI